MVLALAVSRFAERIPGGGEGELRRVADWKNSFGAGYVRDPVVRYFHKDGFFRTVKGWGDFERTDEDVVVMCLGSSTTCGLDVKANESYPAKLEEKLSVAFPGRRIVVLNAGLPGANARHSKRLYQFHLSRYAPDVLIWRNSAKLTDRFDVDLVDSRLRYSLWWVVAHSKLFAIGALALDWGGGGDVAANVFDRINGRAVELDPRKTGAAFLSNFHMVERIAADHGGVTIALDYVSVSNPHGPSAELMHDGDQYTAIGVDALIVTHPRFRAAVAEHGRTAVFHDNEHMSVIGTEIMADAAFGYLLEHSVIEEAIARRRD